MEQTEPTTKKPKRSAAERLAEAEKNAANLRRKAAEERLRRWPEGFALLKARDAVRKAIREIALTHTDPENSVTMAAAEALDSIETALSELHQHRENFVFPVPTVPVGEARDDERPPIDGEDGR